MRPGQSGDGCLETLLVNFAVTVVREVLRVDVLLALGIAMLAFEELRAEEAMEDLVGLPVDMATAMGTKRTHMTVGIAHKVVATEHATAVRAGLGLALDGLGNEEGVRGKPCRCIGGGGGHVPDSPAPDTPRSKWTMSMWSIRACTRTVMERPLKDVLATWLVAGHHLQRAETPESLGRLGNRLTLPYAMGVVSLAAVVAVLLVEDGVAVVACVKGGNRLET